MRRAPALPSWTDARAPHASELLSWHVASNVIERARILRGWTRARLAEAAHVDPKTLRDMLTGRRRPTLGSVAQVARALEIPLGEALVLVDGRPSEPQPAQGAPAAPSIQTTLPLAS